MAVKEEEDHGGRLLRLAGVGVHNPIELCKECVCLFANLHATIF